jgi:hypothetical protein
MQVFLEDQVRSRCEDAAAMTDHFIHSRGRVAWEEFRDAANGGTRGTIRIKGFMCFGMESPRMFG